MPARRRQQTRKLAMAAICAAMGVVLLMLGSLIDVLDLSMAAIASLTVVFAVIELRGKYPYLVFAVTAVLSLVCLPIKTPALIYTVFAGYYPIVKAALEKHLHRFPAFILKIVIFNVALALGVLIWTHLFTAEAFIPAGKYWWLALGTPIFLLYDLALTRLIGTYLFRWRPHFRFLDGNDK